MPLPPRKPAPVRHNLYSSRPAAPSLESLLALIDGAGSAADLDRALYQARAHYAGSVLEQLEQVGVERARFLLETLGDGGTS